MNATPKPREGKVIHPRIPDELHTRLHASAEANRRTLNAELIVLLERALDAASAGPANDLHTR